MSVMWDILNFRSLGSLLVMQRQIVLVSSAGVPAKNYKMLRGVFLSSVDDSIRVFLAR